MINLAETVRSCENECEHPVKGEIHGEIPSWLQGSLYRNGPGLFEVGTDQYNHWFDGLALIHKFVIRDGQAFYQNQFLHSNTYNNNKRAQRIVVSEFGTQAFPDPCKNWFWRYIALFFPITSDNSNINIYPIGDELYCSSESHLINRIDPTTLDVVGQENLNSLISLNTATAHPHVDKQGNVHNMGMIFKDKETGAPAYCIVKISPERKANGEINGEIVAKIPVRWKFHPSYFHSFGMTENYYIFFESPLCIDVLQILKRKMFFQSSEGILKWYENHSTLVHVIEKKRESSQQFGKIIGSFVCDPFFTFHHANAFEDGEHIVVDVSSYNNGKGIFDLAKLKDMLQVKESRVFGRPQRFVLPIGMRRNQEEKDDENLVHLSYTTAQAFRQNNSNEIKVIPQNLLQDGDNLEFPAINYSRCNGLPYHFLYGVSFGSHNNSRNHIIKLELNTGETKLWYPSDDGWFPSEPVFVQRPDAQQEDDGVLLVSLLRIPYQKEVIEPARELYLSVIDAKSLIEIARVRFPDVSVPRDLHGMFRPNSTLH